MNPLQLSLQEGYVWGREGKIPLLTNHWQSGGRGKKT